MCIFLQRAMFIKTYEMWKTTCNSAVCDCVGYTLTTPLSLFSGHLCWETLDYRLMGCWVEKLGTTAADYVLYSRHRYEGWNFNSGNYLFTTDTK